MVGAGKSQTDNVTAKTIIRAADYGVLAACIGAIIAVYILDAIFFAAWGGAFWPVFILIGVVIRTIAVSAGVALQWVRDQRHIRAARSTIRVLWIACLLACLVPAMSFFAGGHKVQTQGADVASVTEEISTSSKTERIARIQADIAQIETNREASIADVNATIALIADDGVPGISASDNEQIRDLRKEIQGYRDAASNEIAAKRALIAEIEQERESVQTAAAVDQAEVSVFFAIFAVIGDVTGWDANDVAIITLFFFALLIEAIAAFGLGAYYDLHRVFVRQIQEIEKQEKEHKDQMEAGGLGEDQEGPGLELAPDPEPEPEDPRANWTEQQWNAHKGALARQAYDEARKASRLRMGPVSAFNVIRQEAAE